MQVELVAPSEALLPYIRVFYRAASEAAVGEGIERVDLGQLRFWLQGNSTIRFPDRAFEEAPAVTVMAPAMSVRIHRACDPFDLFGCSLRPLGWAALVGRDARAAAARLIDAEEVFGPDCRALLERLRNLPTLNAMRRETEAWLRPRLKPVPEGHARVIALVQQWEAGDHPVIEELYAMTDMSERQLARLINYYYGAPPKFLERKFRAMRAAALLVRGDNPAAVAERFYDQPHMIRELKRFVGHTPRALQECKDPILRAALALERFA